MVTRLGVRVYRIFGWNPCTAGFHDSHFFGLSAINLLVAIFAVGIHQGFGISNYIFALVAIAIMLVLYGSGTLSICP